jgi:hypothetical protein
MDAAVTVRLVGIDEDLRDQFFQPLASLRGCRFWTGASFGRV